MSLNKTNEELNSGCFFPFPRKRHEKRLLDMYSLCSTGNSMAVDVTSIRLTEKDSAQIDRFIEDGHFKSRSEFIRYAVKKTINEILLQDIQNRLRTEEIGSVEEILGEIKDIRKKLWDEYAEDLS